jgi:integrase
MPPSTYVTFFGLLACTGMRSGEARRLMLDDFDAHAGILRIGRFKSSPPRTIPLHATTVRALQDYVRMRRRCFPFSESLFVGVTGKPLKAVPVRKVFHRMCAGIVCNGEARHPELSDFRHTFVSHWIAEWSRQAEPVSHHLLLLARYLGHVNFSSTWWYVTSDPRSLCEAAAAFRRYNQQRTPPRP